MPTSPGGGGYAGHYPGGYEADGCCSSGGGGQGGQAGHENLAYVGDGRGGWIQEMSYRYIGSGGDFDMARRPRGGQQWFLCCLLPCLCLLPLLLSWLYQPTDEAFDCDADFEIWEAAWSKEKTDFCCDAAGRGCGQVSMAAPIAPGTVPPTPPATAAPAPVAHGPIDPFNCAMGAQAQWPQPKKDWCCRIHHLACPVQQPAPPPPVVMLPANLPPADPYNCAEGYANWQAGWAVGKKAWCCQVHGKGCAGAAPGAVPAAGGCVTTSPLFDCEAGFSNWQQGWSIPKKNWCCDNQGKGCPSTGEGC